jgi:hypothetical protein
MFMPEMSLADEAVQMLVDQQQRMLQLQDEVQMLGKEEYVDMVAVLPAEAKPVLHHMLQTLGRVSGLADDEKQMLKTFGITTRQQLSSTRKVHALYGSLKVLRVQAEKNVVQLAIKRGRQVKNHKSAVLYQLRKEAQKQDFLVNVHQRIRAKQKDVLLQIPELKALLQAAAVDMFGGVYKTGEGEYDTPVADQILLEKGCIPGPDKGGYIDRFTAIAILLAAEYDRTISPSAVARALKKVGVRMKVPAKNIDNLSINEHFCNTRLRMFRQFHQAFSLEVGSVNIDCMKAFACGTAKNCNRKVPQLDGNAVEAQSHDIGRDVKGKLVAHTLLVVPCNEQRRKMLLDGDENGNLREALRQGDLGVTWVESEVVEDSSGVCVQVCHIETTDPESEFRNIGDVYHSACGGAGAAMAHQLSKPVIVIPTDNGKGTRNPAYKFCLGILFLVANKEAVMSVTCAAGKSRHMPAEGANGLSSKRTNGAPIPLDILDVSNASAADVKAALYVALDTFMGRIDGATFKSMDNACIRAVSGGAVRLFGKFDFRADELAAYIRMKKGERKQVVVPLMATAAGEPWAGNPKLLYDAVLETMERGDPEVYSYGRQLCVWKKPPPGSTGELFGVRKLLKPPLENCRAMELVNLLAQRSPNIIEPSPSALPDRTQIKMGTGRYNGVLQPPKFGSLVEDIRRARAVGAGNTALKVRPDEWNSEKRFDKAWPLVKQKLDEGQGLLDIESVRKLMQEIFCDEGVTRQAVAHRLAVEKNTAFSAELEASQKASGLGDEVAQFVLATLCTKKGSCVSGAVVMADLVRAMKVEKCSYLERQDAKPLLVRTISKLNSFALWKQKQIPVQLVEVLLETESDRLGVSLKRVACAADYQLRVCTGSIDIPTGMVVSAVDGESMQGVGSESVVERLQVRPIKVVLIRLGARAADAADDLEADGDDGAEGEDESDTETGEGEEEEDPEPSAWIGREVLVCVDGDGIEQVATVVDHHSRRRERTSDAMWEIKYADGGGREWLTYDQVTSGLAAAVDRDAFPLFPGELQLPAERVVLHTMPPVSEIIVGTEVIWRYDAPLNYVLGSVGRLPGRSRKTYQLLFAGKELRCGFHELDPAKYGTDSTKGHTWVVLAAA